MLRLKDLPPQEMRAVVEIATELYEQEQGRLEAAATRQATLDAAAEVGLPAEYLERAAAVLHERRVAAVRKRQRRSRILLTTVVAALALLGGCQVVNRPPPAPVAYTFAPAPERQWTLNANPGTQATLSFGDLAGQPGVAILRVERFDAGRTGGFFANLDTTDVPSTLAGYRTVAFRVRGSGLPNVRLYLEAGPTERWRSPALPVSGAWQEHTLRLDQFDHQRRASESDRWRRESYRPPGRVERISFKVGDYVNDVRATGEVAIDDLKFAP
jgi:hypothetical protein